MCSRHDRFGNGWGLSQRRVHRPPRRDRSPEAPSGTISVRQRPVGIQRGHVWRLGRRRGGLLMRLGSYGYALAACAGRQYSDSLRPRVRSCSCSVEDLR